jgi:hypothetical protein
MADSKSASCPVSSCSFCYKNPRHWYVLVATLPFFVKGVQFLMELVRSVSDKVTQ